MKQLEAESPISENEVAIQLSRLAALKNKLRLNIISHLLSNREGLFFNEIKEHLEIKNSGLLAYHIEILLLNGLLSNKHIPREGKKFSKYKVTELTISLLKQLDILKDLE